MGHGFTQMEQVSLNAYKNPIRVTRLTEQSGLPGYAARQAGPWKISHTVLYTFAVHL